MQPRETRQGLWNIDGVLHVDGDTVKKMESIQPEMVSYLDFLINFKLLYESTSLMLLSDT